MKGKNQNLFQARSACIFVLLIALNSFGGTIWNGPTISYSQPGTDPTQAANQDRITADVWLTRAASQGLFNAAEESSFSHFFSPENTEWADGTTDNTNLSYTDWNDWAQSHGGPPGTVGVNAVVHLISDDIYINIQFTGWAERGGGGFAYTRSTPGVSISPPTVTITNPPSNAVFAAPANVQVAADAEDSGSAVTNVQFFANGNPLGAVLSPPFTVTASGLVAGSYSLTAVATASGVSTTSSVVNVSVISPVAVNLSSASVINGKFVFDYTANSGLSYLVQDSSNLVNWTSISTNMAASGLIVFSNSLSFPGPQFYRVGLLPNP